MDSKQHGRFETLTKGNLGHDAGLGYKAMLEEINCCPEVQAVFCEVAILYNLLEQGHNNDSLYQGQHVAVDAIIFLMHRLLSVQPENFQCQVLEEDHNLLKVCWLGTLLCSFQTLFPLPRSAFPFQWMVTQIADIITNVMLSSLVKRNEAVAQGLLWCAAVGALATSRTAEVIKFAILVEQLQELIGITSASVGLSVLRSFFWPESIYGISEDRILFLNHGNLRGKDSPDW